MAMSVQERERTSGRKRAVLTTAMSKGKGLGSTGGSATLQRSKSFVKQEVRERAPQLDDGMGGGGIGKGLFNGGGGDGGGDDDDDDYSGEFGDGDGDGDGGDGFFRQVFKELYDAKSIAAVLQEWYKTMADLPLILRQAAQMGLFSSAALVRFMSMDVRPSVTRFVTRTLPPAASRQVVGRLMADPAFMQKLVLEQMITISCSIIYEAQARGERFWKELDLVATNTLCLSAANAALVYLVAPTRAAPAPGRFEWQNVLARLPNNVFEGTTPMREYTTASRVSSFFVKSAELCGVGMLAGAAQSALSQAALAVRRRSDPGFQPSLPVPGVRQNALGMAAAWGMFGNARYQLVAGIDRYLFDHASHLWSYLAVSGAFRSVSTAQGDQTRRYLQGLPSLRTVAARRQAEAAAALRRRWAEAQAGGVLAATTRSTAGSGSPVPTGSKSSSSGSSSKRKRRSVKKAAGFEMGVGPAPAPAMA